MKFLLLTVLTLGLVASSFAQLQNAGFEEWDQLGNPIAWDCVNIPQYYISVEKSADGVDGTFAAKMNANETFPGGYLHQIIPCSAIGDEVYFSVQYKGMTEGMMCAATVIGYGEEGPVDGNAVEFFPAGDSYHVASLRWEPIRDDYDSIWVAITFAPEDEDVAVASVLLDNIYITGINGMTADNPQVNLPTTVKLGALYPNPFNSDATIRYTAPGNAVLSVFDATGRIAGRLNLYPTNGPGEVNWSNVAGKSLPAGRYTIILNANGQSASASAIYLK